MTALKKTSHTIKFTVKSEHKMPTDIKHIIRRADGTDTRKKFYEICGDFITFSKVKTSDNGIYTISCQTDDGLEGELSFKVIVISGINIIVN